VVLDYLDHNEAELALEHLIYVINEVDLPISAGTFDTISAATTLLETDPSRLRGIDPNQDPIDTLQRLSRVAQGSHTLAVKLLNNRRVDNGHKGPFPGTHLAELQGEAAHPLLNLVQQFEPAMQARCHSPRYSLVFWGPNHPAAEAALCFRCNNGRTRIASTPGWIKFNGESAPAVDLLEQLKLIESESRG